MPASSTAGRPIRRAAGPGPDGPVANRDFRLLFAGRSVSLLGDGAFLVALAWEAYTLSNAPTALSLLGISMTVPLIVLLLFGGVVSDRYDRRRVMLLADARACGIARAARRARGQRCAAPVADDGDRRRLRRRAGILRSGKRRDPARAPAGVAAGSSQRAGAGGPPADPAARRPGARRSAGRRARLGAAFLAEAPTFMVSAAALWSMSARRRRRTPPRRRCCESATGRQLREGWSYVRRHVWLWGTFASAGIAYLLFMGPAEVLLPFMVKHVLGGSGIAPRPGARGGRPRLGRVRRGDAPQRTPLAGHHLHLRRLDARARWRSPPTGSPPRCGS